MSTTAIVKTKRNTLETYLTRSQTALSEVATQDADVPKLTRLILNTCLDNPLLLECDPTSVVLAAADWLTGRIPVRKGYGAIVPRRIKGQWRAQFQPMYEGLLELAYSSNRIAKVSLRAVFPDDDFRICYGDHESIHHVPAFPPPPPEEIEAALVATYAQIWIKGEDRPIWASPLARDALIKHRDRVAPRDKQGKLVGPWASDFVPMCLKTSLIRSLKLSPMSPELAAAVAHSDDADYGRFTVPSAIKVDLTPQPAPWDEPEEVKE